MLEATILPNAPQPLSIFQKCLAAPTLSSAQASVKHCPLFFQVFLCSEVGEASGDHGVAEGGRTDVLLAVRLLGWTHHVWLIQQIQESSPSPSKHLHKKAWFTEHLPKGHRLC